MSKIKNIYQSLSRLSVRQQFGVIFFSTTVFFLIVSYVVLNLAARSEERGIASERVQAMANSAYAQNNALLESAEGRTALLKLVAADASVVCAQWVLPPQNNVTETVGDCSLGLLHGEASLRETPASAAQALIKYRYKRQTAWAYGGAWLGFAVMVAYCLALGLAVSLMLHYNVLRTMSVMRNHFTRNAYGEMPSEIHWPRQDEFGKLIGEYNAFVSRYRGQYEAITEQLGLLETLLQTVPHPITYHNRKFELLGCNQAFVTTMNVSLKNLTGLDLEYVLPNSPWSEAQRLIKYEAHSELTSFETEYKSALDGHRHGLFQVASYLNAQGELAGYICVLQDITELKDTEQALKRATDDFKAMIQFLPVGIIVIHNNGTVEFVNEEYVNMFGYVHEDIPTLGDWSAKAYPDPIERERGHAIREEIKAIANETGAIAGPYVRPVTCKDGSVVRVEFKYYQLDNRGLFSATIVDN